MHLQNTSFNMLFFFDLVLDTIIFDLKKPSKTLPKLHAFVADFSISKSSHLDDEMIIRSV